MSAAGSAPVAATGHGGWVGRLARPRTAVPLLLLFGLATRLIAWPAVNDAAVTPDGARFFNIARCIERGQGFSTPEAWPAWMDPARLPMPETFKEPGYPYAIAAAQRVAGSPLRAGKAVSLLAGLLIPLVVYALMRRLDAAPPTVLCAALLVVFSPLMIVLSVAVMAESLFVAALFAAFALATERVPQPESLRRRPPWTALAAGALFGLAFMVRAQALLALPAFLLLLARRHPPRTALNRMIEAGIAFLLIASPLLLRNLRFFGTPLYSDAAAFGVWPYVDHLSFSSSLDLPPAPLPFALAHAGAVAAQMIQSAKTFVRWTLGRDLLPGIAWLVPLAVGAVATLGALRRWGFAWLLALAALPFLFAVYWAPRYFAMLMPVFGMFAAAGMVTIDRRVLARRPQLVGMLAVILVLVSGLWAAWNARGRAAAFETPDAAAARAEAPFLNRQLSSNEAVMCDITSYWAWYADRPAVHVVIADPPRLRKVLDRLKVRYAAFPNEKIAAYASRFPGGRLPALFVPDHAGNGVTVFAIAPEGPVAPDSGAARVGVITADEVRDGPAEGGNNP